MRLPPLYAVVDRDACGRAGRAPLDVADALLEAGVRLIQVRGKDLTGGELLELAAPIVERAGRSAIVIVNDRADVARLSGAAGVHVGQDDLAVADVRRLVGPDAVVGLSTHSIGQATAAFDQPVSYVAVGPVFGTATKDTGYEPVGLAMVATVAARAAARSCPVVAIGGITIETAPAVLAAGAASVCVISDLLRGDPAARARAYLRVLGAEG